MGKNFWEVRSSVVFLCFWVWGAVSWECSNPSVLAKVYPWDGGWSWKELLLEKKGHKVLKDWQEAGSTVVCDSQRLQKIQAVPRRFGFTLTHRQYAIVDFWSIEIHLRFLSYVLIQFLFWQSNCWHRQEYLYFLHELKMERRSVWASLMPMKLFTWAETPRIYDTGCLNTDVVQAGLERKPMVFGNVPAFRRRIVLRKVCIWWSLVRMDSFCQRLEDKSATPSRA